MTTAAEVRLTKLTASDLPAVAEIHMAAFSDGALAQLGREAVRRYYEWQLAGPHQIIALGCTQNKEVAGFCFAGIFHGAMSGFLRKNQWYLAGRILTHPWLAMNPLVQERAQMSLNLLYRTRQRTSKPNPPNPSRRDPFGVLAIAVHPERQGSGLGRLMMNEVEAYARGLGYEQIGLSVNPANRQAIQFYEKGGWQKVILQDGWNGNMVKDII